jgi:threonine dehydrogenase-like Zn-dependent dehydrogenase
VRALVYTAPLTIDVGHAPEPEPADGETVVEVTAAGICGSELEGFAARSPMRVPPLIMGHEFGGVRSDTGGHVVVNPLIACGRCDLCRRGLPQICRYRIIIGIHRPGGFAERVAVPLTNLVDAPAEMTATQAAFVEPMANAAHALRLAAAVDPAPLRLGVIGAGPLGYAVAATALARGVPAVAVADTNRDRLRWIRELGIDEVAPHLDGEFDVIVDAVGTAETRQASTAGIRPGGVAVWLGLHGTEPGFDGSALVRSEKVVVGSFCYTPSDFAAAVHHAARLSTPWATIVDLEDSAKAFRQLLDAPSTTLKTIVRPPATGARWD